MKKVFNTQAQPYVPKAKLDDERTLVCSLCQFQFPTHKHLVRCEPCSRHGRTFQACHECMESYYARFNGGHRKPRFPFFCPCCSTDLFMVNSLDTMFNGQQSHLNHSEKAQLSKLSQFRMVIPNLLYVIGLPKRFGREDLLRSQKFFGQFGKISRVLINNYTKDFYEQQGQCAVYIWYESQLNVAVALKCLNGLRLTTQQAWRSNSSRKRLE